MGCSTLKGNLSTRDEGLYSQLAPAKNAVPLPVEIARDIERITEDGMLVMNPDSTTAMGLAAIADKLDQLDGKFQEGIRRPASEDVVPHHHHHCDHAENHEHSKAKNRRTASHSHKSTKKKPFLAGGKGPLMRGRKGKLGALTNYKSSLPPLEGGKTVSYIVKLGDTLMKIAFEKHADYLRWKDIYSVNKDKMISPRKMKVGTELTIENVKYVYIKRDGKPYLIRKEDTLKSISKKLYGTEDKWKDIWKNNPQLVKNPKKIYAGFTLYYQPKNGEAQFLRVPAEETDESSETPDKASKKASKAK
jgi:nucleoid-associated protein YgaU